MASERQRPAVLRSVVPVLCLALVAWGLHGKLSGYTTPNRSHPKPVVKLMQDDLTRRIAISSAPVIHSSPFLASADPGSIYAQPRLIADRCLQVRKPAPDSGPSQAYALCFRPPPSTT
jgi:hypothetical protein